MKKRVFAFFLSLMLLSTLTVPALAAGTGDYTFAVLVNGAGEATVEQGETVTVSVTLTKHEPTTMAFSTLQDYVCFDADALSYVEGSAVVMQDVSTGRLADTFWASLVNLTGKADRLYISRANPNLLETAPSITIASFQMKAEQVGTTTFTQDAIEMKAGSTYYSYDVQDATLTITEKTTPPSPPAGDEPSGGGGGGGGATIEVPATEGVSVWLDGKSYTAGELSEEAGKTIVTVDASAIQKQLSRTKNTVEVVVGEEAEDLEVRFPMDTLLSVQGKNPSFTVKNGSYCLTLPSEVVRDTITSALGMPKDAVWVMQISRTTEGTTKSEVVDKAIQVGLAVMQGEKITTLKNLSDYATLTLPTVKGGVTTAIAMEDGRHLPTYVTAEQTRVLLHNLDTVLLVRNTASFADAKGTWYEDTVEEMASRYILQGRNSSTFDGTAKVTRAEFAAILVRALGLTAEGTSNAFTDVAPSAWYAGAVSTAAQCGLISGRGNGCFAPNAPITREEAMVMLQRTANVTGWTGTSGGAYGYFSDADKVSAWAKEAVAYNVGNSLIIGNNGMLRPTDTISRAESATVILRLLQKAEFIDIRTVV